MTRSLFLLAGQSNMAGRGVVGSVPELRVPGVFLWRGGAWVPAVEPLHDDRSWAGVGLALSFAAAVNAARPDAEVGLVPCAMGGSPLADWMPGAPLFIAAAAALRAARASLGDPPLAGILWHQGETDAGDPGAAASYGDRLLGMLSVVRGMPGLERAPVIVGELGSFLARQSECPHWETVNAALRALPSRLSRCACVSADGLTDNGDALHFDAASLRTFGARYAVAYLAIP